MAKRIGNLMDATLPKPPLLTAFVEVLSKYRENMNTAPPPDPIHGQLLANRTKKRSGSENNERAAVRSALEFVELCEKLDARYEDLDSWLVAWGAWTMDENLFFASVEDIAACRRQRVALAG